MNKFLIALSAPMMFINTEVSAQQPVVKQVDWSVAATLKNADGTASLGFAGPINAISNDALLIAGGANFPGAMPWDGGKKHYAQEIHVLEKTSSGYAWNNNVKTSLPAAIAYCGNTSTSLGVVYVGGENAEGLTDEAYLLTWNAAKQDVAVKELPKLPLAMTNVGLTQINDVVYAVGGDQQQQTSAAVFSLDLKQDHAEWQCLTSLPIPLANAVVVAQAGKVYVIGGRTKTPSGISTLRNTTYVYHPQEDKWQELANISDGKRTTNFSAGAGVAIGDHLIMITGGDNGEVFHQIETYISQIAQTTDPEKKAKLIASKNTLSINHKGFYKATLLYNTETNQWSGLGELPFPAQVTTTATLWDGAIILSNGEIKPGVRTPVVMRGEIN